MVAANTELTNPHPAPLHVVLLSAPHPQAAAVHISIMVEVQDAVRLIGFGVKLEVPVPLPGATSKTASISECVGRGGIEQPVTGAQDPSIEVPELV